MNDTTNDASDARLREEADAFRRDFEAVQKEIRTVIVGHQRVVEATLTALLCGGNVLLEGVPGLGKTELVKALSHVLDLQFHRVQFTPDLMPADIIGTTVMNSDGSGNYQFEFRKGPIFTQLLLADEINRASPKTQSALLETMQEGTVSVGGTIYELDPPFFVMATQNPIEQEGTYPLPEAQLDRFMFKVEVLLSNRAELNEIVQRTILKQPAELTKHLDAAKILKMREVLDKVVVADPTRDYAVRLVLATHAETDFASDKVKRFVRWGASPRAVQALIRAARVRSLSDGRAHVAMEDVRYFVKEVLGHRVLLNYEGQAEGVRVADLVNECIAHVPEQI